MYKNLFLILTFLFLSVVSCTKKIHPLKETTHSVNSSKTPTKQKLITSVPKVIIVSDKVAKRSLDGRYYYDLNGHRYWRNNNDGKYYLFHKSMFEDEAFKATGRQ